MVAIEACWISGLALDGGNKREDVAVQMGTPWKTQRQAKKSIPDRRVNCSQFNAKAIAFLANT